MCDEGAVFPIRSCGTGRSSVRGFHLAMPGMYAGRCCPGAGKPAPLRTRYAGPKPGWGRQGAGPCPQDEIMKENDTRELMGRKLAVNPVSQ